MEKQALPWGGRWSRLRCDQNPGSDPVSWLEPRYDMHLSRPKSDDTSKALGSEQKPTYRDQKKMCGLLQAPSLAENGCEMFFAD